MTLKEKIKACYKILFKNKPISTLTVGVEIKKCAECENNIRCNECVHGQKGDSD